MLPDDRIIVFSLYRSGSSVLNRLCHVLAHRAGYKHFSLARGDVIVDMRQLAEQPGHWLNQPGCFGPLRMYIPTPRMEDAAQSS